jgi:hypothetical protein
MSSTPTISNQLELQGTGDNAGTWGTVLDRALSVLDEALDGITTVPVGPDVTLTSTNYVSNQSRKRILKCTGTGGNVTIPGVPKWYFVDNACTGLVTIKTAARAGVSVQPGTRTAIYCDGANCAALSSLWPLIDGTAAAPGLYFSNDVSTGLYRLTAGTVGVSCGGSSVFKISATGLATSLSTNGPLSSTVTNANAGTAAEAFFSASNGTGTLKVGYRGTAQTTYGALTAGSAYLYANAAPLVLMADSTGTIVFAAGGNAETARATSLGGVPTLRLGLSSYNYSATAAALSIGYLGVGSQYGITLRPQTDTTVAIDIKNASGTTIGSISQTAFATAFNTSSDYRLKDQIADLTGSGEFIDALQPRSFVWRDGPADAGFIAHEVAEVSPASVTGAKDAVDAAGNPIYQAMQAGSPEIIAMMVAELQALRRRVAALEARP